MVEIPSKLLKIVEKKKSEVASLKDSGWADIFKRGAERGPKQSDVRFYDAISAERSYDAPNLIAEFKRTSPSNMEKGNPDYRKDANPQEIGKIYQRCYASAISVLTDEHFKGDIDDLRLARVVVDLPLLRKDFIIDPCQIHEARYYGADAILLITGILEPSQIKDYLKLAHDYGMDCLVESHNKEELKKSIDNGAKIIGINNRNLHTFEERIETTLELLSEVSERYPIVTESCIKTYGDVKRLSDPRIKAMLIGTELMKAKSIEKKIYELQGRQ